MSTAITDPTALADQIQAATTDARTALHQIGAALGGTTLAPAPIPPWITEQAAVLVDAITAGHAVKCPHVDGTPRVALAAVWAPGHLVCPACAHDLTPDLVEEVCCDRCGRYSDTLHPGIAALGPVLLAYGLCCSCLDATGLGAPRESDPADA